MFRHDGRLVEWHVVRALPREARAAYGKKRKGPTDKQRLRSKMYNLTLDINALRQEIMGLCQTRELLYARHLQTRSDGDGSTLRYAIAFNELTQTFHTLHEPAQRARFDLAVAEDIMFGPFRGRDNMRTFWNDFDRRFATIRNVFNTLRVVYSDDFAKECTIRLDAAAEYRMTRDALEVFYPAVLNDPLLTARVVGQRFQLHSVSFMTFNATGQMIKHDAELDLLGAFAQLIGDTVRAAKVVEEAVRERQGFEYVVAEARKIVELEERHPRPDKLWGGEVDDAPQVPEHRHMISFLLS